MKTSQPVQIPKSAKNFHSNSLPSTYSPPTILNQLTNEFDSIHPKWDKFPSRLLWCLSENVHFLWIKVNMIKTILETADLWVVEIFEICSFFPDENSFSSLRWGQNRSANRLNRLLSWQKHPWISIWQCFRDVWKSRSVFFLRESVLRANNHPLKKQCSESSFNFIETKNTENISWILLIKR